MTTCEKCYRLSGILFPSICVSLFLAAQTFTKMAWREEIHSVCVVEEGLSKTHTRDVHTQTQREWKKSIRSWCLCATQRERGRWRGHKEEGQRVRNTKQKKKTGGETVVVSGIKSRRERCLFINASWLLKGAFD